MKRSMLTLAAFLLTTTASAVPTTRPMHPPVTLLDAQGAGVLKSGAAVSTMKTCGNCHNTEFIATHSYHASAGFDQRKPAGQTASGRAWDTSPGLFGRFNPLSYHVVPANPSSKDIAQWSKAIGERHVGGGPAMLVDATDGGVAEMNCFLCHLPNPDNAARVAELKAGRFAWAATATLASTGVVKKNDAGWKWNPAAFNADGTVVAEVLRPHQPRSENCGICHGQVQRDLAPLVARTDSGAWTTATTGQIFSPQRLTDSGMNLAGKDHLSRPFDVHAERLMECTNCHFSTNNPLYTSGANQSRPQHLGFEARKLTIGQFLLTPSHDFAKGHTPQGTAARQLDGSMRRCEDCHNAEATHTWLPYTQRHFQAMNCEACHVPQVNAPAIEQVDWTIIGSDGQPGIRYRGVNGPPDKATSLVTGYQPVLLPRRELDGKTRLTPHNLITSWFWVAGTPPVPVSQENLRKAMLVGDKLHPDLVAALDRNRDGQISADEMRLDSPERVEAVRKRLAAVGLESPKIVGEIQPYSLHHGVATGTWATRQCNDCHARDSRVNRPIELASYVPGGVQPTLVGDANVNIGGRMSTDTTGRLFYEPSSTAAQVYVLGHDHWHMGDWFGILAAIGTVVGVGIHGGMRFVAARRNK